MNSDFKDQLRAAYDADAQRRADEGGKQSSWKLDVRQKFVDLAKQEGRKTILEIGAGAGANAKYFQDQGFDVLATDLSPKMIEACKALGLKTRVIDIYELDSLDQKFDAIYSLNVLLHVPPQDLKHVLATISNCLQPNGIFQYGVYGGRTKEEIDTDPSKMNMPRYFSFLSDEDLLAAASEVFNVISFDTIDLKGSLGRLHFQSLLLRKK